MFNVAVIGGGVIGLPSALAVQRALGASCRVVIFAEELSPNTTGDVAAGLWTPYLLLNTPLEKIAQWARVTQEHILEMWKRGEAKEAGISLQLIVKLSDEEDYVPPAWVSTTLGYSVLSESQLNYYRTRTGYKITGGVAYMAFIWEAAKFLPLMMQEFLKNNGTIIKRRIDNFAEIASEFDVIVNCAGLNARFLTPDEGVYPVRGQVIRVAAPWVFDTLMLDNADGKYIIPNGDCVILGGTHQEGDYNLDVDQQDRRDILEGCCRFFPSLQQAVVLQHGVGLRPGRSQVRVELERRLVRDKVVKIVHNYGHGGSGITLSMGCAADAAQLVKEALGINLHCKL